MRCSGPSPPQWRREERTRRFGGRETGKGEGSIDGMWAWQEYWLGKQPGQIGELPACNVFLKNDSPMHFSMARGER